MHTWKHPTLGLFKFEDYGWKRSISIPAFKPFRYAWGGKLQSRSKFLLVFDAEEDMDDLRPEEPTKAAIRVADRLIANQEILFSRILKSVWLDFNGLGPETGMWWHGDIRTIHEAIQSSYSWSKPMPFDVKEDLFKLMGVTSISIKESVYRYEKPCAVVCFDAAMDPEHGVGVLTDGSRVLGIGYQGDAAPYKTKVK